jgi:hypothetical protein
MNDHDAALMAILATAYASKMRAAHRPEWLVLAFLALVRSMRRGGGDLATAKIAIAALATQITRYVNGQVPSAADLAPGPVVREFQKTLDDAGAKARKEAVGAALAARLALVLMAETQNLTLHLTAKVAVSKNVGGLTRTVHSDNPCERCAALEGDYTPPYPDDLWWDHPRCLPAGAIVFGPKVHAGYERWYSGMLVEMRTRNGYVLTCTPNHPVLTPNGWVAAASLIEGCYVLCAGRRNGMFQDGSPDDYQVPALIEDVARTLGYTSDVASRMVPTTPEDFHGDGMRGKVRVIWADGLLRHSIDAALGEPFAKLRFSEGDMQSLAFDSLRAPALPFERLDMALPCCVRGGGIGTALLSAQAPVTENLVLAEVSHGAASGNEPVVNRTTRDAVVLAERQFTLAREVACDEFRYRERAPRMPFSPSENDPMLQKPLLYGQPGDAIETGKAVQRLTGHVASDEIVKIDLLPRSSCHVYNLQTADGWYAANTNYSTGTMGIVTHNCCCEWEETA